ncbi:MAG: sensor histidine kinase [Betaproteobacteria bacterium]|nr:MAG: sensor histidine kinase [Betaproteobacteria bacterium]
MNTSQPSAAPASRPSGWERFSSATASGFRRYAEWLVGISWKKFFLLSLLLLIAAGILAEIPPFSLKFTAGSDSVPESPAKRTERAKKLKEKYGDVDIKIDHQGIHIKRNRSATPPPEPKTSPDMSPTPPTGHQPPAIPAPPAVPEPPKGVVEFGRHGVTVNVPPGTAEEIRAVVEQARESIREAIEEEIAADLRKPRPRVVRLGGFLPQLALLLIVVSMVIKIVYAGRVKAEVKAAEAQETADSESLRRQVVEARMAAMQAQVEPHFLFNTLASIDHLIEVDPARASVMQKNLIALLRASMPGMRETETNLGRELAVVRPYLEILRVRMGERLQTEVNVSAGLHSAEFPPMMLQSLVENAIKHGLEPKPEGGTLRVGAEVVHGRLEVSVADTGVGFGRAATAGTGVGLANIRERLKLLYGGDAELRIADNAPAGTRITVVVPYRTANYSSRA